MKSNHRSPIWPYLLVLAGLFALCVKAPRGWQTNPTAHRATSSVRHPATAQRKLPPRPTVLVAESGHVEYGAGARSNMGQPAPKITDPSLLSEDASSVATYPVDENMLLVHAEDETQFPTPHEATATDSPPGSTTPPETFVSIDARPTPEDINGARSIGEFDRELLSAPEVAIDNDNAISSVPADGASEVDASRNYDNWPLPVALIDGLERLGQYPGASAWAGEVGKLMDRLTEVRIDDPAATKLLTQLRSKSGDTSAIASDLVADQQRELEQVKLDLLRRLALWEKAAQATATELVSLQATDVDIAMQSAVSEAAAFFAKAPVGETWRSYLLLPRLEQLARETSEESAAQRRRLAGMVLARMADPRLSDTQRQVLAERPLVVLARRLRGWAVEKLPLGELLYTVEDYEQARVTSLGRTLAEQAEVLANSRDAAEERLGCELARQYRNANLRLVVTRDLLNRLLPQPEPALEPVRDTIVGVQARGQSTTQARLSVRLFPARDQIRFGIEAAGVVDSQTASTAGPVTFFSHGESNYRVGKLVVIDRNGLRAASAMADADNRTRLSGLQTDFDGVPIVRNLIRGYALSQHDEKREQAAHEVEVKVADRASERLDAEVNARLTKAENEFRRRILKPLIQLQLDPTVVQFSTTPARITARLRLAGDDQAAAHTPRPLAMSDSLASLQIHESALNNALDRFRLAGRTFTLPELYQWIGDQLGRAQVELPDDLPDNVSITFAESDPVRVRCVDGSVELTLAIAELDQGRRVWNDFEITVYYRPLRDRLRLEFTREGSIELGGEGYKGRTEIGLRGIFAKVFSHRRKLQFDPAAKHQIPALATLEFSSAIVDNGWISVTIADAKRGAVNSN